MFCSRVIEKLIDSWFCALLQAFKGFRVQYEMKKRQTESLLLPVHRDGKLSVDQALVKQAWERVAVRVRSFLCR